MTDGYYPVKTERLALRYQRPDWHREAECYSVGVDQYFFEAKLRSRYNSAMAMAKKICRTKCRVRFECLLHALVFNERHGVWGGFSQRELREIRARGADYEQIARQEVDDGSG